MFSLFLYCMAIKRKSRRFGLDIVVDIPESISFEQGVLETANNDVKSLPFLNMSFETSKYNVEVTETTNTIFDIKVTFKDDAEKSIKIRTTLDLSSHFFSAAALYRNWYCPFHKVIELNNVELDEFKDFMKSIQNLHDANTLQRRPRNNINWWS